MSGHSKWAKIKRSKGIKDVKKGALYTKLAKNISLAAKEGGNDLDMNFSLRLAIDKAKQANMPMANVEKAIKKGTGDGGEKMDINRISYEAFGPGGASIIIDCQTDNTNRTVAEVRRVVEAHGGKFTAAGSVSWKFQEKGLIIIELKKIKKSEKFGQADTFENVVLEDAELELMEIENIDDIKESTESTDAGDIKVLELLTEKIYFASSLGAIEKLKYKIISAELIKVSNEEMKLSENDKEKNYKLIEALDELDDIDSVWVDFE